MNHHLEYVLVIHFQNQVPLVCSPVLCRRRSRVRVRSLILDVSTPAQVVCNIHIPISKQPSHLMHTQVPTVLITPKILSYDRAPKPHPLSTRHPRYIRQQHARAQPSTRVDTALTSACTVQLPQTISTTVSGKPRPHPTHTPQYIQHARAQHARRRRSYRSIGFHILLPRAGTGDLVSPVSLPAGTHS